VAVLSPKEQRPFFARTTLANIEIFAVIGIFSLYVLEFIGIHTFSQLISPTSTTATIPALSFTSRVGDVITINAGTAFIMVIIPVIIIFYFKVISPRLKRK